MVDDFDMLPSAVTFLDNRLCYNGQYCQRIPQALIKIYGPKVHSLDLSYNELISILGVEGFNNIRQLILDNNQLTDNIVIPYLPRLDTLSLNKNQITDLSLLLSKISKNLPSITYLSLLGNKACPNGLIGEENDEKDYQSYRYFVLHHLPNLKFLDSKKVRESERTEAHRRGQFMNVIKPSQSNEPNCHDTLVHDYGANSLTPLPKTLRRADEAKGSYGKCQYRYSGKHSEGNRFISNNDL